MKILVTGGAGYIGSHTVLQLLQRGDEVVVVDNFINSKEIVLKRIKELSKKDFDFFCLDVLDKGGLTKVFKKYNFDAVIHFAGLKSVGESVSKPLKYYQNNITGTLVLLECMAEAKVKNIVFSSSATVYGDPKTVPITESFPVAPANPYGRTKLMIEEILRDWAISNPKVNVVILRYFNPIGAHESGRIGEDPNGIPNNLVPFISQVAVGKLKKLSVFGEDYDTIDGSGVRDYIHVEDLAEGHLKALTKLTTVPGVVTYNLGTGKGSSVFQVIKAFEKVSKITIPYDVVPRRHGDVAEYFADPMLAEKELGWKAKYDIYRMCEDCWRWQTNNPKGYID